MGKSITNKKVLSRLNESFEWLVRPRSVNEDYARRETILNILLLGTIFLGLVATLSTKITHLLYLQRGEAYPGLPGEVVALVTMTFLAFYFFSRGGLSKIVAYLVVFLYHFSATYTVFIWGTDVPQALLTYALVIVMAGVLIGTKFAFVNSLITSFILISLTYLQSRSIISPNLYWTADKTPQMGDIVVVVFTLGVIMAVSWLFNREIEMALKRARGSEKALKKERDLLEVRVSERTKELNKVQLEKVQQMYRLADFGRMTAGLFHELVNPLTMVSLNLERLQARGLEGERRKVNDDTAVLVGRAVSGTKRMEEFVKSVRKQIQKQKVKEVFSLNQEINHVIKVLDYKAQRLHVKLHFVGEKNLSTYGNSLRFNQLVTNLVTNAIDAYDLPAGGRKKAMQGRDCQVIVRLSVQNSNVVLTVQDFGCGIVRKDLKRIFNPFFTTKSVEKGTGIGLSICKSIVEKELNGKIKVESEEKEETIFTCMFPFKKPSPDERI